MDVNVNKQKEWHEWRRVRNTGRRWEIPRNKGLQSDEGKIHVILSGKENRSLKLGEIPSFYFFNSAFKKLKSESLCLSHFKD